MYTFSFIMSIGVGLGLFWAVSNLKEKQASRFIDESLGVLLGGLVGSRMVFVAVHWTYYQEHLVEIPQVWAGGLSAVGALAGGFMVYLLYAGLKITSSAHLADQFFPAFMLIATTAWLGSWSEGVAYGTVAAVGQWGLQARDEWGVFATRFPTQYLGAALTFGCLWIVVAQRKRWELVPGWLAAWGLLTVSMIFTGLTFLRADPVLYWQSLRLDTIGGISLMILAVTYILLLWRSRRL